MIVEIVDAMMGVGKTNGMCKWMEENRDKYRFFYISPLLDEVKDGGRIQQACPLTRFVAPETIEDDKHREDKYGILHKKKGDHLLELLQKGANITCTHNLYLAMTDEHFKEMEKHDYVLIIDEELGMINDYNNYSTPDVTSLIKLGCLEVQESDGMLVWKNDNVEEFNEIGHQYYYFKKHVDNNMIYVSKRDSDIFVSQLPVKLLTVAKRAIILTYMFDGNLLSCFLKLKGIEWKPFTEIETKKVCKKEIASLINLYTPTNKKWSKELNLSVSGYNRMSSDDIKHLTNYIGAICREWGANDYNTMFTFPKIRSNFNEKININKIKPKGFIDSTKKSLLHPENTCWIASITRATNKYRHKTCVIHAYDRYPNQKVASYLQDFGCPVNKDVFALSEMLQFIWRSAIRDGKPIDLAVLSGRMKSLLLNWLNEDE